MGTILQPAGEKNKQEQEEVMNLNIIMWAEFLADPDARAMIIEEAIENNIKTIEHRGQILWKKQDTSL